MKLDTLAEYFLLQFKEIGGDRWQFEGGMPADGRSPATLMAYASAFGAEPNLERHRRAGRNARLVSMRGPEVSNIDGEQKVEIYGSRGYHHFKALRQLLAGR